MLTIQVDNADLEEQIALRARAMGKSDLDLVLDIVRKALNEHAFRTELGYSTLDPTHHTHTLQFDKNELRDDAPAFQHVNDTIAFANELRQNAWKR